MTISLFGEPSIAPRAPSSFAISIVAHGLIAVVLYVALAHVPAIKDPSLLSHYDVRQLDLHAPKLDPKFPELPQAAKRKIPYPLVDSPGRISPSLEEAMQKFLGSAAGRQTIIQPEFHTRVTLAQQIPLPNITIWTPGQMPRKQIAPPPPDPDTSSFVTASLDLPTQELKLADVSVTSTDQSPRIDAIPASSTSPIETPVVKPVQKPLITASSSVEQPTPAAMISVSELHMEEGTVFVPPVNDVAKSNTVAPENRPGNAPANGFGNGASETQPSATVADDAEKMTADSGLSVERIVLPKDGKFNVVVVGNSMGEDYPQTADVWANRMAYTAYLHVGLKKNWILQYSLTRAAEVAAAGNVARLEAPWPYEIMRPNLLTKGLNADALMVHGVLNPAGRLESLAIAFPAGYRYASYVLHALRQWQFRPARQNGQATAVEILLIIPDDVD